MEIKSSYKLEEIDDRYFVFDGGTGNIFEINRIMYELLLGKSETELRDRFSSVEISDVKNSMIEAMDRGILSEQNLLTRTYQRMSSFCRKRRF